MNPQKRYYTAVAARDPRFDGKFFFGVKTTGIYCRPICPAKPKKKNIIFFRSKAEAEAAGYRACLRCRPDALPSSAAWIGTAAVVKRAVKMLNENPSLGLDDRQFANRFGLTSRHLRRLIKQSTGQTPKQISSEVRLKLAFTDLVRSKKLISEIALASGYSSVRRFNDAFKLKFALTPTEVRNSVTQSERRTK